MRVLGAVTFALVALPSIGIAQAVTAPPPWAELPPSTVPTTLPSTVVAPPSSPAPFAEPPAAEAPPAEPLARLALGFNFRQIDLAQVLGGDLGLSVGRKFRVEGGFMVGETLSGRGTYSGRIGVGYVAPLLPFHLGFGSDWDLLGVQRVTNDSLMTALALEFYVTALVDVLHWEGGMMGFLGLRAAAELIPQTTQGIASLTLAIGLGFGG